VTPPRRCPFAPLHLYILVSERRWWRPWRKVYSLRCPACGNIVREP